MKKSFLLGLIGVCLISCKQQKNYYEETGTVFNTYYTIKYQSEKPISEKIDAEFEAFNLSLNPFHPQSVISKVNRNEEVVVDERFKTVFEKSMLISQKSGGMFDATVSPFINLWGFGFEKQDSVTQEKIDSLKMFVGYQKIRLEGDRIIKDDPRITLNFSAIAKGYACDVIAALLEKENIENYMVDIGGEMVAKGVNPKGACWRIGINEPEDQASFSIGKVKLVFEICKPSGLATSGNYRNFYIKDGKKYSHTIHPFTGYPAEQDLLSATIVAPDCMTADAYATACMTMGLERACQLIEQIPEIEYYFIYTAADQTIQEKLSEGMLQMMIRK